MSRCDSASSAKAVCGGLSAISTAKFRYTCLAPFGIGGRVALFPMHPLYSLADRGQHLIRDRAGPLCDIFGGDALGAVCTDDSHHVAEPYARHIGDVDGDRVHAHRPDERCSLLSHQHVTAVAAGSENSVGVS